MSSPKIQYLQRSIFCAFTNTIYMVWRILQKWEWTADTSLEAITQQGITDTLQ